MTRLTNQDIFHLLQQKTRYLKKRMDTGLKDCNLYMSQWSILFCLNKFGEMTQTEIRTYLNVEAPTITRTLERMEKNDWIVRKQGNDKRERIIVLTENAGKIFNDVVKRVQEMEEELLRHLSEEERKQLYNLLYKIEPIGEILE